jgi:hypothetical protein
VFKMHYSNSWQKTWPSHSIANANGNRNKSALQLKDCFQTCKDAQRPVQVTNTNRKLFTFNLAYGHNTYKPLVLCNESEEPAPLYW